MTDFERVPRGVGANVGEFLSTMQMLSFGSQADIAKRLSVSQQSVSRWVNGSAVPSREAFNGIAATFGLSPEEQSILEERTVNGFSQKGGADIHKRRGQAGRNYVGLSAIDAFTSFRHDHVLARLDHAEKVANEASAKLTEAQKSQAEVQALALGSTLYQLALREQGLPIEQGDARTSEELLGTASILLGQLGLAELIAVQRPES